MKIKYLSEPFSKQAVHWRIQGKPYERNGKFSAMALAYLDARDVMDRLDLVCGPENWQDEYAETPKGRVLCRLGIRIGDEWVWKSDGAGETAVEAEKGGISDALKRAAVHWGIGRYLYRLDAPWVECEVNRKGDQVYWKKWAENPWDKIKSEVRAPDDVAREMFQRLKGGTDPKEIPSSDLALVAALVPAVYSQHIAPFIKKES